MSDYEKFYEARDLMQEIIRADLLGPMPDNPEEIIKVKYPTTYYIIGKLYPISQNTQMILSHDDAEELTEVKNTDDRLLDNKYGFESKNNEESGDDDEISGCNILNPSSMGITFALKSETKKINVILNYALYKPIAIEEAKKQNPNTEYSSTDSLWRRYPANEENYEFDLATEKTKTTKIVSDGKTQIGELVLIRHKSAKNEKYVTRYTLSFKNIQIVKTDGEEFKKDPTDESVKTIFQPKIEITVPNGYFLEVKRYLNLNKSSQDDENKDIIEDDLVMDLLYSKVKSYAQGHGCAVSWDDDGNDDKSKARILRIKSEFLPEEQILQMRPVTSDDIDNFDDKILNTEYLKMAPKEEIARGINNLCDTYQKWIDKQKGKIDELEDKNRFEKVANNNLKLCKESLDRIRKSAEIIMNDDNVYRAFTYANNAINEQHRHKEWISKIENARKNNNPIPKLEDIKKSFKWFPFQLAFILQELESIANPDSEDRNLVDLLWFPTGGGKTEAYLGLAAFTIFLRRLKYPGKSEGVTVLTRYTYRLLTFQQFERTLRLICACEEIRKHNKELGKERISIGLWIGKDYTPNYIKDAIQIVKSKQKEIQTIKTDANTFIEHSDKKESNPIQITKCPWCGTTITAKDYIFDCETTSNAKKMFIHCPNDKCEYNKINNSEGLPAIVIDEQIYEEMPAFVIATVDKFAQIPQRAKSGAIFGYLNNGEKSSPPDLIIQDELHLLTGPLGTITGIYEAGFKKLCDRNGHYPKVISSTATVKNAKSQIKSLYGDKYSQFPAQGLDIKDSFFAKESTQNEKPGRKYMGCMAVGTTPITMMVRVMAILYFASRYISVCKENDQKKFIDDVNNDNVIDSFWTITGYFNTLRELGGAIIRIKDDVQARFEILREKYKEKYPGVRKRPIDEPKELTSRMSSSEIGTTLAQISNKRWNDNAAHFLLATNMISVGVDIDRLGSMIVVGQPKMTAEYIQSTSRVGRKYPGFVLTTYNQKKSRDRSHFEQFKQYHQSFYKFVEATSITPFSDRARNRALHTIYVMLCRYLIPELRPDEAAGNYINRVNFTDRIKEIKTFIIETVRNIDNKEENNVKQELEEIDNRWYKDAKNYENIADQKGETFIFKYAKSNERDNTPALFKPDIDEDERFRVMTSMRSVEKSAVAMLDKNIYGDFTND